MSLIKKNCKGNDSKKKILLIMIDAQYKYYQLHVSLSTDSPPGLKFGDISHDIAKSAYLEALKCYDDMALSKDDYSNIRFYINTPYYSRSDDPFKCYSLTDPSVISIVKIVQHVLNKNGFGITPMINIIVRLYWNNSTLSFHSDRKEFGDDIFGVVIHNSSPDTGLILTDGKDHNYMVNEYKPVWWYLKDEARWEYKHGYVSPIAPDKGTDPVRISISFRFYQDQKQIPYKKI
jgi:hypothetical protein